MRIVREHRSSESNFTTLHQTLLSAQKAATESNNTTLADELNEVEEKYVATYTKARETGGTAWPEFEKFVTEFERALTGARKDQA